MQFLWIEVNWHSFYLGQVTLILLGQVSFTLTASFYKCSNNNNNVIIITLCNVFSHWYKALLPMYYPIRKLSQSFHITYDDVKPAILLVLRLHNSMWTTAFPTLFFSWNMIRWPDIDISIIRRILITVISFYCTTYSFKSRWDPDGLWSTKLVEIKYLAQRHKHTSRSGAWTSNVDSLVIMGPVLLH